MAEPRPPQGTLSEGLSTAEILWGLIYTHDRANANTTELEEAAKTVDALVELLVDRGVVTREELDAATERAREPVRRRFLTRGMAVIRQDFDVSKHDYKGSQPIDCENRIHACKASCCRLQIGLSGEDVTEGILHWDPGQPYALAKREDGWCVHSEHGTGRCTVYEHRPIPCRAFDCREDSRIWVDFDAMIPNPNLDSPSWPEVEASATYDGDLPPDAEPRPA